MAEKCHSILFKNVETVVMIALITWFIVIKIEISLPNGASCGSL